MSTTADVNFCPGKISEMEIEQPVQEWGLHLCNSLEILDLRNVESLECVPCPGFSLPCTLVTLTIMNFQNLRSIASHGTLSNLTQLMIYECPNLESLFDENVVLTSLEYLQLENCPNLKFLPGHLPSLQKLNIERCKGMSVLLQTLPSSLKEVTVIGCKKMSTTADVSFCSGSIWLENISEMVGFPCLGEQLKIVNCESLITCEPGRLTQSSSLKTIEFRQCENMESFPSQLHHFSSLQKLRIEECPKIKCFPEGGLPKNLTHLYIREMKIEQPVQEWGLHLCNSLKILEIREMKIEQPVQEWGLHLCNSLNTLNLLNVGTSTESLECIPCPGFSLPGSLDTLRIKNFQNLKRIASHCTLPNLTVLEIIDCPNLEFLGGDLITSLKSLQLETCPKLESLFDENVVLTSLRSLFDESLFDEHASLTKLQLRNCRKLKSLSGQFTSLEELIIESCRKLESLFDEHAVLASLTTLQLKNCSNLKFLSGQFTSLGKLFIENCLELRSFPKACLSPKLRWLRISTASIETPIKEWGLHLLTSLSHLIIEDVGNSSDTLECTTELHLPSSLSGFYIKGFKNLKTIPCSTLPNLFVVSIKCCPKFESFGDNGLPSQLEYVFIEECELIQQKLKRDPMGRNTTMYQCKVLMPMMRVPPQYNQNRKA